MIGSEFFRVMVTMSSVILADFCWITFAIWPASFNVLASENLSDAPSISLLKSRSFWCSRGSVMGEVFNGWLPAERAPTGSGAFEPGAPGSEVVAVKGRGLNAGPLANNWLVPKEPAAFDWRNWLSWSNACWAWACWAWAKYISCCLRAWSCWAWFQSCPGLAIGTVFNGWFPWERAIVGGSETNEPDAMGSETDCPGRTRGVGASGTE